MLIDLTHFIEEGMPVYPGTEPPKIEQANTIEKDGFAEKLLTMFSHTGTHMDAPCHIVDGMKTLSDIDINELYGSACLIDASEVSGKITKEFLKAYEQKLRTSDIAVIYTGWDRYWGEKVYFEDFPVMDTDAAEYISTLGINGIAVDVISVDSVDCYTLDVHKVLFSKNIFVVENLKGLDRLKGKDFCLGVFPLNIEGGDGSPVRAVAFL